LIICGTSFECTIQLKEDHSFQLQMKVVALLLAICLSVGAFSPLLNREVSPRGRTCSTDSPIRPSSAVFLAGGFGGGGAKKTEADKSTAKQVKPKPKQQWDRYQDLKTETKIAVAIRMKEDDSDAWLRVGYVRSKDSAYTAISVAIQRALIAEVCTLLLAMMA
jgi:hypothetical protein